jgi:putative membrane protein
MKSIALLVAAGLALAALPAYSADEPFYETLAQAGMAEVMAGKLAANRGTTDAVRDFGMMMMKDHGAANQKLADLAKTKGIQLPATAGEAHLAAYKSLQSQKGARFDPAYIADQVKGHEEAVQLLKTEIASGQDPDAKKLAEELLPTVEGHLKEANRLAGKGDTTDAMAH